MVVTRVLLLQLLGFKIEVVDLIVTGLARFPVAWQRGLESFLGDVVELLVISGVHAQVLRVFLDFLEGGLVV